MHKMRKVKDNIVYAFIYLCTGFSLILLVGILLYVFVKGIKTVDWSFWNG